MVILTISMATISAFGNSIYFFFSFTLFIIALSRVFWIKQCRQNYIKKGKYMKIKFITFETLKNKLYREEKIMLHSN